MAVTLKRETEAVGSSMKFKVWVNGTQIAKIAQKEVKELSVPEQEAVLQIKQFNGKSNKLIVNDGDHVKVTNGSGLLLMLLFIAMLIPVLNIFDGSARWIGSALVVLGFLLILQFVNIYKLEKLDDSKSL
ncbi:hypothetical protein AB4027_11040 [Alkalibacterium putridalgicola]|uniref:hypothetical protein n=1 Tax=Alkalibacterium putridalgicola TaxID=426703 RepID=UPI0034CD02BB